MMKEGARIIDMADVFVFELSGLPRATVTREDDGSFKSVVDDIDGLAPTRTISVEEATLGITSLNPPTCVADTAKDLVEVTEYAVAEAVDATDRASTPGEYLMITLRVGMAVKGALRGLGEDV
jgi:hypothetical protein